MKIIPPIAFLEYNNGLPLDDFVYISQFPLQERGFKIITCERVRNNYSQLSLAQINHIAIGSVEFCSDFFKQINLKIPEYIGYPRNLGRFLNRNIRHTNLKEVEGGSLFPIFVKPVSGVKQFTGTVLNSEKDINLLKLANPSLTEDLLLFGSEVIDIESEYRVFVHSKPDKYIIKDKIVGIKHYTGNFKLFPNKENVQTIYEIIEEYTDSPICYTLDIGIDKNNKLYLIEINDFWALGSYGLDGKVYVKMTIDRFNEIKSTQRSVT